jgi:hypothetical protein
LLLQSQSSSGVVAVAIGEFSQELFLVTCGDGQDYTDGKREISSPVWNRPKRVNRSSLLQWGRGY